MASQGSSLINDAVLIGGVLVAGYFVVRTVGAAAGDKLNQINPASDQNIIYGKVNDWLHDLGVPKEDTLGTWLYNIFHPEPDSCTDCEASDHGAYGG